MNLSQHIPNLVQPDDGPPDSFEQSLKLAFEMHNAGRVEEAETLCRALEQIRPKNTQLLFLLGMVLHKTGQNEEAAEWLSLAAQLNGNCARIFNGLGCVHQALNQHAAAAAAFERAIALEPQNGGVFYNLGKSCYRLEQVERAAQMFRQAVEIDPQDANSWNNLGKCLKELNCLEESIAAYDRALEIKPDYALARYGRAISLLAAGRLREGFREYEWRWHSMTPRKFPQPAWHGEPAPGKTLFIHAEQGFGDAIQMVRFVPAARQRMARVILECRQELKTLFEYSKCADTVISYGAEIPSFDFYTSTSSLPHALDVTLETISHEIPYLQAPAHARLLTKPGHLKVGLAWAGNPNHHQDTARSIPLPELAPILQVPGVTFYSLQQPVPARDEAYLATLSQVHANLKFEDFLHTASVISELDLIISVDTAIAHLAGALGRPVWLLLQHSADWRWFLDRPDTPWYPGMQLFRQAQRNQWQRPIKRLAEALQGMVIPSENVAEILPALSTGSPIQSFPAAS